MPQKKIQSIAPRLLKWFDQHGRKNLPWQVPITPYRVWLSEIMLQQTQVETVIPYFNTFVERFPTVEALANASQDEVLHLWTGLGYYARARNLHKCALTIANEYQGVVPDDPESLVELPGIGRSTAHAITSIAFEQPTAILDGNVKRVLARYHAIEGWPGKREVEQKLWQVAEAHMPSKRCRDYTQAIMDLGATLCTRSSPQCNTCPISKTCVAYQEGDPLQHPGKKPKKEKPIKQAQMLIIRNSQNDILLEQRPAKGIWGGLWVFPEIPNEEDAASYCESHYGSIAAIESWLTFDHVFSHYTLRITPVIIDLARSKRKIMEGNQRIWYKLADPQSVGLAAPVKKLLKRVAEPSLI